MTGSAIPTQEATSAFKPESVRNPLRPLSQIDLNALTSQAHGVLIDSGNLREKTTTELAAKLTSVSDDLEGSDVIKKQLASELELKEEEMERARGKLKTYTETEPSKRIDEQTTALENDVFPDMIDNLEYVAAVTQGDATQSVLHESAVQAKTGLSTTTEIEVTTKEGKTHKYSLSTWDKIVDRTAQGLWKKELNPSASDADFDSLDPLTRFAYRQRAKKQITGANKDDPTNKNIRARFTYLNEVHPQQAEEKKLEPEADPKKRTENALTANSTVVHAQIEQREKEGVKDKPADAQLDFLMYIQDKLEISRDLASQGKPHGNIDFLTSLLTTSTRRYANSHIELQNNPEVQKSLAQLESNENYYKDPNNDPVKKFSADILTNIGYVEKDIAEVIEQMNNGTIDMGAVLGFLDRKDVQGAIIDYRKSGDRSKLDALILKSTGEDNLINRHESRLVKQFYLSGVGEAVGELYSKESGINPKELSNVKDYLMGRMDTILENAGYKKDGMSTEEYNAAKDAYKSLVNLTDEDLHKLKTRGGFNPMWLLGLAMGVPMIAPVLDTGKDADEQTR